MRKRRSPSAGLLVAPTLVLALAAGPLPLAGRAEAQAVTGAAAVPTVRLITLRGSESGPRAYTTTVDFPVLSGSGTATSRTNAIFSSEAARASSAFSTQVGKQLVPKGVAPMTSSLTDLVETETVSAQLVSFSFFDTYYWAGAAHPYTDVVTTTVNLATGGRVGLASLFRPGPAWLTTVAAQARRALLAEYRGLGMAPFITAATKPVATNFQGWSLTPFGLRISFSQGVAGPEAAGVETVVLPFAGLAPVARPGGPMEVAAALHPARMALLPATVAPRVNECFKTTTAKGIGQAPATCPGGDLNVAAWDQWEYATRVLTLGAKAPEARIKAALCQYKLYGPAPVATLAQLGVSYYGWPYSAAALSQLPKTCP